MNQLCSLLQAEAMALLWAVHLAIQNRWYSVIFEGDSKICIDALNYSDWTPNWSIDTIICNIHSFSSYFTSCSFGWVCRSSNSVANVATRFALNCLQPFCFFEGTLPPAIEVACKGDTPFCFP